MRVAPLLTGLAVVAALCAACGSSGHTTGSHGDRSHSTSSPSGLPDGWVDQDVSFTAGAMKIYGSYRHPAARTRGPAVLLIAGSGNPDRNGNEPGAPENSLRLLADQLAADGVATLRYDKLFSGRTGPGPYAGNPSSIGLSVYSQEASAALEYLAAQSRTDPAALSVFGHSEGGLYALFLATGTGGVAANLPRITSLGLIEPASKRLLDVLGEQLHHQIDAARDQGKLTAANAASLLQQIDQAIATIRAGGTPTGLPSSVQPLFGYPHYLRDIDQYDPAQVAARLPHGMPVLLTCSDTDSQVPCTDVVHLASGLKAAGVGLDFARLTDMDHGLKHDTSPADIQDLADLPMAPPLAAAIARFVKP